MEDNKSNWDRMVWKEMEGNERNWNEMEGNGKVWIGIELNTTIALQLHFSKLSHAVMSTKLLPHYIFSRFSNIKK